MYIFRQRVASSDALNILETNITSDLLKTDNKPIKPINKGVRNLIKEKERKQQSDFVIGEHDRTSTDIDFKRHSELV